MENNQKIVIGKRILTKEELFKEKEKFRKERAKLLFDEKIKALVQLQQLALSWGNKKDVIIWRI
ncbi:MAG: hypothetical protein AB1567_10650 [bacterium]